MNRLKLIGAALLLVIFDTYTASADPRSSVAVESGINVATGSVKFPAHEVEPITETVSTGGGAVDLTQ